MHISPDGWGFFDAHGVSALGLDGRQFQKEYHCRSCTTVGGAYSGGFLELPVVSSVLLDASIPKYCLITSANSILAM
jgi:hypothetical protein